MSCAVGRELRGEAVLLIIALAPSFLMVKLLRYCMLCNEMKRVIQKDIIEGIPVDGQTWASLGVVLSWRWCWRWNVFAAGADAGLSLALDLDS